MLQLHVLHGLLQHLGCSRAANETRESPSHHGLTASPKNDVLILHHDVFEPGGTYSAADDLELGSSLPSSPQHPLSPWHRSHAHSPDESLLRALLGYCHILGRAIAPHWDIQGFPSCSAQEKHHPTVQLYQGGRIWQLHGPSQCGALSGAHHHPLLQVPGSHPGSSLSLLGREGCRAQPADFSKPSSSQQLPHKERAEPQSPWRLQLTLSHTLLPAKMSLSKPWAPILTASAVPKCSG